MEAVGFAASIVALVEVAGSTVKVTRAIRQRLKDAPRILSAIETDLHLIHSELQHVQLLHSRGASGRISPDGRQAVLKTLDSAQTVLRSIETTCVKSETQNGKRKLLRWALVDHPDVEKQMNELKAMQSSLKTLFQIIGLQEQSNMSLDINLIKNLVIDLSHRFEGGRNTEPELAALRPRDSASQEHPQKLSYDVLFFPKWLQWLGCHVSFVKISEVWSNGSLNHYVLAFQLPIVPGIYSLGGQIALQKAPYCQSLSIVAPSVISLGFIVTEDSAVMTACARGDLFTLKQQLKSGKATLGDMTSRRWSLMTFAIKGGSKEVVEFLLDNGIDVNMAFGENQTSPLQWAIELRKLDIVEALVSRGADVNHISMIGWSAIFYLWPITEKGQGVMLNQVDLLSRANDIELNLIDKWGWTLLHRLAAYGTGPEVRKVINLGADLMIKQLPLGWSAVFHSVFYGNMETLIELMPYYPQDVTDERGWTLLHIVASAGHKDITRHLLKARADSSAKSKPFFSHMPESIWGKRCTPADVAAAQSRERLGQYEELLEDLGIESTGGLLSDGEEGEEKFWDAKESLCSQPTYE